MPERLTVRVPDIGEFDQVDVVEVLVAVGERVEIDQALVVLESDKASMEIPAPAAGVVESLEVSVGAQVSEGSALCTLALAEEAADAGAAGDANIDANAGDANVGANAGESNAAGANADAIAGDANAVDVNADANAASEPGAATAPDSAATPNAATAPGTATAQGGATRRCRLLVLGGGPGGYSAAFRAADLGIDTVLVERYPTLGGVCLNVGCIPSKALLHIAEVIEEARALSAAGVDFGTPAFDWQRIRARKDEVVKTLTRGLAGMAKMRKVEVITGHGRFTGANEMEVQGAAGAERIAFEHAILATGSRPAAIPGWPKSPRILDSTGALEIDGPPGRLLVVGGGVIGLEMATVYLAFGWRVTIVEMLDRLLAGVDRDLVKPLERRLAKACDAIHLNTSAPEAALIGDEVEVQFSGENAPGPQRFDRVLVAIGRRPNSDDIGLDALGVARDERGFVPVDARLCTNAAHVFAVGDLTGAPLLAHRAIHQGKVAAEATFGGKSRFEPSAIPAVAYTDPEVAWVGLTEEEAEAQGVAVKKSVAPWGASGRAIGIGRTEGLTKLLFSAEEGNLLGAGIVGPNAGELLAEATLAIELGADAADLGLSIHAHPTLSETVGLAAEVAEGRATDLPPPKKR